MLCVNVSFLLAEPGADGQAKRRRRHGGDRLSILDKNLVALIAAHRDLDRTDAADVARRRIRGRAVAETAALFVQRFEYFE